MISGALSAAARWKRSSSPRQTDGDHYQVTRDVWHRHSRLTSWPSIRTDLRNAAAEVIDPKVVTDRRLIPNRSPQDLPAFCRAIIECFAAALRAA
ncbi:DJ-1/PfpI family protein [Streptomyces sp. NPDC059945]|uniref:DJ-1/PfpI family protein n=1 Tax=Streptomyces sp. NPDC059945 TaxID=3347012 RepID=UPI00365B1DCF